VSERALTDRASTDRQATDRDARIAQFVEAAGWGAARRAPLAGDASFRRYERLTASGGETLVLMDAPPPQEDVRPFVKIARHLASLGLSAPRIVAADETAGLLLLEDFGDSNMARLVDAPGDQSALYALATDTLAALHRHPRAGAIELPAYDSARLAEEACLLLDWYLPALAGRPTPPALREEYVMLLRALATPLDALPRSLVLRDYFPDNLMYLPDRAGVAACGLLDFQDALLGPVAYDLVSLLEDARRDVPDALKATMRARYLAAFPVLDREDFMAGYQFCNAQRNLRIIGVFTRLCRRDRKPGYLRHIPRLWRLVEQAVAHPTLRPLEDWLACNLPRGLRRMPNIAA
jgi:aminoglycoside/choline kinase family phosphotransferase